MSEQVAIVDVPASHETPLDVAQLRQQFPILSREVNGRPLVYLDNAATCQKPEVVLSAQDHFLRHSNANIHRGLHTLSQEATDAFELARRQVQQLINAPSEREVIFTRGTTEAINLVAQSWGRSQLQAGDEILVSMMEHHANIVPWQLLAEEKGLTLNVIPVDEQGALDMVAYQALLSPRTRLVAVAHVSNALGTVNPVHEITRLAKSVGAVVLIDGAQGAPHLPVDVQQIGADFYALSGHKIYGPTGMGALYGREALLEMMPPWQGGGEMIDKVTFEKTTYAGLPHKFEAGTPAIAEGIAMGRAAQWLMETGVARIGAWEHQLTVYATDQLKSALPDIRIIGQAPGKAGVISFVLPDAHAQDIGLLIDQLGVAIRTGHHCAMPVLHHFGVNATARASFAAYNTMAEVDVFVESLVRVREMLV